MAPFSVNVDFDTLRARGCVVTGGLGFIGSNLVHRLVAEGVSVRIVDAVVGGHGANHRNIDGLAVDVIEAQIGDLQVGPALRGVSHVFNLAGQVSHTASMIDPVRDLELNTISHARFLEMLRQENPSARVVHTSTRQVYGRVDRFPVDEQTPARPIDVNGVAKLAGEHLHMVCCHAHRMPISSLRLTNVYGPRQRLTSDELGFLPVFVRKALQGDPIELFGGGEQRRDCLFVYDVVDAVLAASAPEAIGAVYNVGGSTSHSLKEIATILTSLAGTGSDQVTYADSMAALTCAAPQTRVRSRVAGNHHAVTDWEMVLAAMPTAGRLSATQATTSSKFSPPNQHSRNT